MRKPLSMGRLAWEESSWVTDFLSIRASKLMLRWPFHRLRISGTIEISSRALDAGRSIQVAFNSLAYIYHVKTLDSAADTRIKWKGVGGECVDLRAVYTVRNQLYWTCQSQQLGDWQINFLHSVCIITYHGIWLFFLHVAVHCRGHCPTCWQQLTSWTMILVTPNDRRQEGPSRLSYHDVYISFAAEKVEKQGVFNDSSMCYALIYLSRLKGLRQLR